MTVKEFQQCIEFNIKHNIKHAVLGLGAPGVGKSEAVKQIGSRFGFKVIDLRLAQMSEVEIGGLIYPNESRTKTVWLTPEVLPDEKRDGKNTILLLDEITSCPYRVQVAAYQLILDRRIGQYTLPEGTFVIALGNREDDDGVYIQLAGPLADRFEIHYIEPSFEVWKNDYALKNNVHPYVVSYLNVKPSALHTQQPGEENMIFATPRSWVRVSDILHCDSDVSNPVVRSKIIGNIGDAEGVQFIGYCEKHSEIIPAEDFISGRAEAPSSPDMLSLLTSGITAKAEFIENKSAADLTDDELARLRQIISALFRLPVTEFTIIGVKDLLSKNRTAVKQTFVTMDDKYIRRFLENNRDALGISGGKNAVNRLEMWNTD